MKKLLLICLLVIGSFNEVKSEPYPQNYYGGAYPQYPNYQSPRVMNSYGGVTAQDILSGNSQYQQPYRNQGESFWSKTGRVLNDPAFANALSASMQNYLMMEQARTQAMSNSLNSVFQNSFHKETICCKTTFTSGQKFCRIVDGTCPIGWSKEY
jgi:hypothetical protein